MSSFYSFMQENICIVKVGTTKGLQTKSLIKQVSNYNMKHKKKPEFLIAEIATVLIITKKTRTDKNVVNRILYNLQLLIILKNPIP